MTSTSNLPGSCTICHTADIHTDICPANDTTDANVYSAVIMARPL